MNKKKTEYHCIRPPYSLFIPGNMGYVNFEEVEKQGMGHCQSEDHRSGSTGLGQSVLKSIISEYDMNTGSLREKVS